MSIPQHSNKSVEHGTPPWILDCVRATFQKHIDMDPCSTEVFNQHVDATVFYTKEEDGLLQPWAGDVYVNPPGGRMLAPEGYSQPVPTKEQLRAFGEDDFSAPAFWWQHTWRMWVQKKISQAAFMCFNPELLRYAQQFHMVGHPLEYSTVVFRKRLEFNNIALEPQTSPAHMNMLFWLPPHDGGRREDFERFFFIWSPHGYVHHHTTVMR